MAARPDDTVVYFRADYSSASDYAYTYPDLSSASSPAPAGTGNAAVVSLATPRSPVLSSSRDVYGNSRTSNRGAEQYARTQRILAETLEPRYVDVLA